MPSFYKRFGVELMTDEQKQQLAKLFNVSVSDVLTDCKSYYSEDIMLRLRRDIWLTFSANNHTYRLYKCEKIEFYDPYSDCTGGNYFDIHLPVSIKMHQKISKALEILRW